MSASHDLEMRLLREAARMYDATRGTSDEDSDGTDLLTLAARLTKQVRISHQLSFSPQCLHPLYAVSTFNILLHAG